MQNARKLDWNDFRHFIAIARHGSTIAAARVLGVDPSTVQRRLVELERCVGQPLVRRHPTGYRLTGFGESVLDHARLVEQAVDAFGREVAARSREAVGIVRVTCPEPIVARLVASGLLDRFHAAHPRLRVEFVASDRYLDLAKGEVDVALRSGDTDDGALVGRRIGDSLWAVYASRDYAVRNGLPDGVAALADHPVVALDASMSGHRLATWLHDAVPDARIAARNGSVLGMVASVRAGVGVGALPVALGDADPELVRAFGPVPALTRIWRMLTTPELRRTPRVSAFFDFVVDELDALRPVITG